MKPYQQPPVFKIGRFRFDLQAITPVRLPVFSGAALRGAFGTVFRRLFCVDRIEGDCHSCLSRSGCGYALIFATPNNPDNKAFTKNTDLTRPFVLEIENGRYFFPEGASFQVRVTLVGRSIGYLPYFIIVFQELGRAGFGIKNAQGERGKYQVKRVCQILSGKETDYLRPGTKYPIGGGPGGGPGTVGRAGRLFLRRTKAQGHLYNTLPRKISGFPLRGD